MQTPRAEPVIIELGPDGVPTGLVGQPWNALRDLAACYAQQHPADALAMAVAAYDHAAWEVRAFAVHLLGRLAAADPAAFAFLEGRCTEDAAWQVNEALAMAFDAYCAAVGYARALAAIERWLAAPRPNQRRAVSEGLRPWTASKRRPFAEDPALAVELLGRLRDDDSRAVQESVGNALRDIARRQPELVRTAVTSWLEEVPASRARQVMARHALRGK